MMFTGYIYKLENKNTGLVYYGSSDKPQHRLADHKAKYKKGTSSCCSDLVFENGTVDMEIVETVEYKDRSELFKREGYYQKNFVCVNRNTAGGTHYERNKRWCIKNSYLTICECGEQVPKKDMSVHKRSFNHSITVYGADAYIRCVCGGTYTRGSAFSAHEKGRVHMNHITKVKQDLCPCGSIYTSEASLRAHKKSKKHKIWACVMAIEEMNQV